MKRILGFLLALLAAITFAVPTAHASELYLLSKTGVLSVTPATRASEVVGFEYIERLEDEFCIKYYKANPPLVGTTQPELIFCPLGVQDFLGSRVRVDYKEAVDIFLQTDCGGAFNGISLSWPTVYPQPSNPIWKLDSVTGEEFIVSSYNGKSSCE